MERVNTNGDREKAEDRGRQHPHTSESSKAGTQQRSPPTEAAGEDPEKTEQEEHERRFSRFAGSGRKDSGTRPADAIQPPPVWVGS